MKKSATGGLLISLFLLYNVCASAATNLLPGFSYYKGEETLTGKLTFLVQHNYTVATNSQTAASIYEFDLRHEKFRKLTDCPSGSFIVSRSGETFCVIYWLGAWGNGKDTNAFVHWPSLQATRSLSLEGSPQAVVIEDGHVFFRLRGYGNLQMPGYYVAGDKAQSVVSKIVDYDIARDERQLVELPDASKWQYQSYEQIHAPRGQTNILHFYYNAHGNRLGTGTDHRDGIYAYNLRNRQVLWFAELTDDEDDESHSLKAANGHYIFFQGTGAPVEGFNLISSPWSQRQSGERDPNGEKSKLLHAFPKLPKLSGGTYWLDQLSPDRRFALVRLGEPTSRKSGMLPGWTNTYFLVDVSDGKTRILIKDQAERETNSSISPVRWVGSPQ